MVDRAPVLVWQWDLDAPGAGGPADRALLSEDEQMRAGRYAVSGAARRFTAGRAALRRMLAAQRGHDAAGLVLQAGSTGKPFLPGGPHFNLSHSGPVALFAIADFPVGIDIERVCEIEAGVATLVFHPDERAYLDSLAETERTDAFFRGWTRKEAIIKARGGSVADIGSVIALPQHVCSGWQVIDLQAPPEYHAAIAAPCTGWEVIPCGRESGAR